MRGHLRRCHLLQRPAGHHPAGYDRGLDLTDLARRIRQSRVRTVILFPPSGERLWQAMEREYQSGADLPKPCFTTDMRTAVSIAYRNTPSGTICLPSPAAPSFGLFRDYLERGESFKRYVEELGSVVAQN